LLRLASVALCSKSRPCIHTPAIVSRRP